MLITFNSKITIMKKQLLLFFTFFTCLGLFSQTTVKLPDNTQYGSANSFQAKITSLIPTDYQAKVGDLITVKIAGTSDYDLTNFQLVFSDTREVVSYWNELSGWKSLANVSAGVAFDYSTTVAMTKDAAGAGSSFNNLVLEAVSVVAINASAPEVTLTLTTFELSIESSQEGVITLTDNGTGSYQGEFPDTLATDPAAKIGDIVRVTIEGTSNVDITDFQAIVVDGTEAAAYWKELATYTLFGDDGTATGGTPFSLTADIEITSNPIGTGFKSQFIVIIGKASESIKLSLTKFTSEIVTTVPISTLKTANSQPVSIAVYSINGANLGSVKSTDELKAGIYILVSKYADGSVKKSKIVKRKFN